MSSPPLIDYLDDSIFVFALQQFIHESMGPGIDGFHDRRGNRVGIVVVGVVADDDRLGWIARQQSTPTVSIKDDSHPK